MQPVVVRLAGEGAYHLVAGERRWRAAKIAGLGKIPAIVREIDEQESAEWALIENLQREDLNPIERAEAFQKLVNRYEMAHETVAERVGLERSTVTNLIRLLKLEPGVRQLVADGLITMGHARALLGVAEPGRQRQIAEQVVREGWSVRQTEAAVRQGDQTTDTPVAAGKTATPIKSAWIKDLERQVQDQLGMRVAIKTGRKKGSGAVTISYTNLDEFDGLMERMGVKTE